MSDLREFEFEAFEDNFSPTSDEFDFPGLTVDIRYKFHAPEPDVGIFESQLEIVSYKFYIDGKLVAKDEDGFVEAVYEIIGDHIEDTIEAVQGVIHDQLTDWEGELEE